jgi:hypothetical protein
VNEKPWQAEKALVTFLLRYCAIFATTKVAAITDWNPIRSTWTYLIGTPHLKGGQGEREEGQRRNS